MDQAQRCFELLQAGDEAALLRLIAENPAAVNARDTGGVSLLMQALYRGRRPLADAIAARKSEIDIFEAAGLGRVVRLRELARDRQAVQAFSRDGFTALHFACYFGQPEAAGVLLDSGAKSDAVAANPMRVMPLHSAASARNLEAARMLLEHGAPINARQQGGWTPIHAAAQNGDRTMVELLLERGADARLVNDQGQTPGMVAREKGHGELAELLEK